MLLGMMMLLHPRDLSKALGFGAERDDKSLKQISEPPGIGKLQECRPDAHSET